MKRLSFILLACLLTTACQKKDSNHPVSGLIPGSCDATLTSYDGAVIEGTTFFPGGAKRYQDITVNADQIDHPSDKVIVYLCRGTADCRASRPTTYCKFLPGDTTTACYDALPLVYVVNGHNVVRLLNTGPGVGELHFDSYAIDTMVCR